MATLTRTTIGSFRFLMDQLFAAQGGVLDSPILAERNLHDDLNLFRWRSPAVGASTPALYNQMSPEASGQADTARRTDSFTIETRIGLAVGQDEDERLEDIETYFDAYRDVMDPIFRREVQGTAQLLGGAARWAERLSAAWFADDFGGTEVVGLAVVQRFDVPRLVLPAT